ncbi:pentatricopeptide repeat-containing protein CRP1, chloroplastic [Cornus florida]|uniref:pentatricopeptide repeat-containing protein CRP1, chloroplastic n=1 Tax=Cornus florida TaxID=4283 RepID=UPI00289C549B|nr:pentatricopeptide repeat-containing protein CRP1, chloroplastic [Cornus florida]XP_059637967.1 pentatricopeptide repeat-containing protein CRP1, chloroplastic [Cornus florida]
MNLKHLFSRKTVNIISRLDGRIISPYSYIYRNASTITTSISPSFYSPKGHHDSTLFQSPKFPKPTPSFNRYIHSKQKTKLSGSSNDPVLDSDDSEEDGNMNEFLSRFVWIMRGKLSEVYSDCDKQTIDGMLLIIVGKVVSEMEKGDLEQMLGAAGITPSDDVFSEDLWRTVWEVSNLVLDDMKKAKKKDKMKGFLQSEEVKEMCRFAGEVGIRGDMLRELRFKWAREKMEEREFYDNLQRLREEDVQAQKEEGQTMCKKSETMGEEAVGNHLGTFEEKQKVITLPKRCGKIKYKIYGLDLSDLKWAEVADKIHERGEILWPQEPKTISGRCKLVTERILSLKEEDDYSPLLAEWVELLQPSRIDWIALLDKLKEQNTQLYFKVAEHALAEESFQTDIRDYTMLIDAHAKANRLEDAERILVKMKEIAILPDILTYSALVHMYSKAGNIDRAKEAFENLRSQGFRPDTKLYNSMIMAYVSAGQSKLGESLIREMETRDMKPTEEIYMALLRSYAKQGDVSGAQRIAYTMQFAGLQDNLESCTLLIEAYGQAGDPDQARSQFDRMITSGLRADDRCIASMTAAYEKKNLLDKALNLLLQLEKDGCEPGVATYSVLVDWLGKLQLIDEAEQVLGKIAEQGDPPPFKVHISLCEMYSRAGAEKKALQALGVVEAKKELLGAQDFERIIKGLVAGGFEQDAQRVHGVMETQGFVASQPLKMSLQSSQAFKTIKRRQ